MKKILIIDDDIYINDMLEKDFDTRRIHGFSCLFRNRSVVIYAK